MPRKTRKSEDRLIDCALHAWIEWILAEFHERRSPVRSSADNAEESERVWEVFASRIRSNIDHSDPVLARLCEEESQAHFWPAGVNTIIMQMPERWRMLLLCRAAGMNQSETAAEMGLSQQHVSAELSRVRAAFVPRLMMLAGTASRLKRLVERVHV
ncbi:helix-turn-helix domain-containing protein [Flagellatimonas centrodinii]|uniref:helix-turn-helix domain-containing protein n=1 Tax=Flagellatimonas centrodinii TaxID=2806210 RepID=UPI001FEF5DD8|nr:helix-turn-helix domain-containing protein [Flagellatimonas centrodinii]ULQ46954.1 helix-turn-helix domain-containing protein [Flagellatimonas centrodinii]